jgi:hypothetical protein
VAEECALLQTDLTVTVKGSPVRSLLAFIDRELTPAQRTEVFAALPPEIAERFARPLLATETIPVNLLNALTVEAARVRNEPIETFGLRAGRAAANDAVKGIYRFFAMVLTPPALLSKASQMWRTLYNRGDLQVQKPDDHSARIRLVDFPSELAGCARITGWIEGMATLTGAKNITVKQVECYAKGEAACEWYIRWD